METFLQDIRHGMRVFFRSPVLMITIVLTLALGIGADTAIFSLVNAVMLRPLPVRNPQELVVVGNPALVKLRADGSPPRTDVYSYPLYRDFRDVQSVFSGMLVSGEVNRVRVARPGEGTQATPITDQALDAGQRKLSSLECRHIWAVRWLRKMTMWRTRIRWP